jgi:hypothetical protein
MGGGRPAAGGGRWIEVAPERLRRWLDGFAARHGQVTMTGTAGGLEAAAADGAVARVLVPFPPDGGFAGADPALDAVAGHAAARRVVGVVLVRRGGHAAGVFDGTRLVASKVDHAYVQGRTKAGGWSQHRFARRRANQADQAVRDAAAVAARVLLPHAATLDAVVLGGDRAMAAATLDAPALAPLRPLLAEPFLAVPDPRLAVLQDTPRRFRAVRVHLVEPHPEAAGGADGGGAP